MPSGLKSDDDDLSHWELNIHVLMFKIEKHDYFIEKCGCLFYENYLSMTL